MVADEANITDALDPFEEYEIDDGDYKYVPDRAKIVNASMGENGTPAIFTIHVGGYLATVIDSAMDELSLNQNFADISVE